MFTLLDYCKRYHDDWYDDDHHDDYNNNTNDDLEVHDHRILRQQTESMTIETRQSLTQKIVETLNEEIPVVAPVAPVVKGGGGDPDKNGIDDERDVEETNTDTTGGGNDGDGDNVEAVLEKVESDLVIAQQRLVTLEEKERFLAVRISKYKSLLQEQTERVQRQQKQPIEKGNDNAENSNSDDDVDLVEELHHQEQVAKFEKHQESLLKIVDIHLDILRHIKSCKRTIESLESKKIELKSITTKCRQFLIVSADLEREQQLGIIAATNNNNDFDIDDLQLMEMAPMIATTTTTTSNIEEEVEIGRENEQQQSIQEEDDNDALGTPDQPRNEEEVHLVVDEETGLRQTSDSGSSPTSLNLVTTHNVDNKTESSCPPANNVEPLELTV